MAATTFNFRVDGDLRRQAETVFGAFGMTLSEAIRVFLHKSVMVGGMPFDVRQSPYNAVTEAAMEQADRIAQGRDDAPRYTDTGAMLAEILAEDES